MKMTPEIEVETTAWELGSVIRHLGEAPDHLLARELGEIQIAYIELSKLIERARAWKSDEARYNGPEELINDIFRHRQ